MPRNREASRVIEKENTLSLIKLRLQYLTMILHALNICLCLQRSSLLTHTLGVDVPIGEDGRRHIDSKCGWLLFFCDCCMCDALNYRCWRGLRICRLLRVREKLRCGCAWIEPKERIFLSTARCGCRSNRIRQLSKVKRGDTTIHFDMSLVNYTKMSHFPFHQLETFSRVVG